MTTDRFSFEDFTGTITCDWTSPETKLELVFDDRLRTAWREVPIRDIELFARAGPELEDEPAETKPSRPTEETP